MFKHLVLLCSLIFAAAHANAATHKHFIDIPPDATTAQLLKIADHSGVIINSAFLASSPIAIAAKAGERNMAWLKHMNAQNPANPMALTKPGDLTGTPIEKAKSYSPTTVQADLDAIFAGIPESMKKIIFDGEAFTNTPPVAVDDYILWAKKVDKVYQTATRWTLMQPYLTQLAEEKRFDIRGYYYLNKEADLAEKLANWDDLEKADKIRLSEWLVGVCLNGIGMQNLCESELSLAISRKDVTKYYSDYFPMGKQTWDNFFSMPKVRTDLVWNSARPDVMIAPFRSTTPAIEKFLVTNIEDEWKWNKWQLKLEFSKDAASHVEFVPGTTPHVNDVAGSTITMDDNAPLTEWDVQWTIRHEYGHVLGFTDCYVEYYDAAKKEMVNYQLDVTNLMCSRMGKLKQTHFDEMKKNYYK